MDVATSQAVVQQARALLGAERFNSVIEQGLNARVARGVTPESIPRKGKQIKGQSVRQTGDSELTEPDSDDDSLLGDDPQDLPEAQLQADADVPESLSREQLIQRRLGHIKSLFKAYKVEYWALLEELRTRHQRFRNQPQALPGSQSEGESAGNANLKRHPSEDTFRDMVKRQKIQPLPAGVAAQTKESLVSDLAKTSHPDTSEGGAPQSPLDPEANIQPESISTAQQNPLEEAEERDARGEGSEEEPVTFSDAEAQILRTQDMPGAASKEQIRAWRAEYRQNLTQLTRLEQGASASACRELDRLGAIACFCGRFNRFIISNTAITLGRATESNQVDIDLSTEGDARKVSRLQAQLSLKPDGRFQLKNIGRRRLLVNNRKVDQGQVAQLSHLSLVEVGGARLLFLVNHAATKRASNRSQQLRSDL